MKRKSESLKYFKEYKAIADASTGGSFIELRSDNGGEYTSKDFQSYLSSNGIAWRPSTPRTPEQNAIAERAIRTICTKVRSMLLHADLSEKYWCYAAEAAAYIYNRMTHKASGNKTPFELFHGYKPNISNLRTFGCIGVSHIKRKTRGPTSVSGQYIRLLGYHPTFGTYIVRTKSGKILSRRVAKWYESTFKYPKAKQKVLDAPASENDEGEKKARTSSSSPSTSPASPKNDKPRRSSRSNRGVPSAQYGYTYAAAEQLTKLIEEVNLDDCFNSSVDYMIEESIQATVAEIEHVPKTYKEAISPEFSKHWIPSMRNELKSLKDLKTFTICKLPSGANLVRTKWVYRNKINPDDTIRRKSRLVAKGFTQREGQDYFNTYWPTLSLSSLRMFLSHCAQHNYRIRSIDVKTAYLWGELDVEIYMEIPAGYEPTEEEKIIIDSPGLSACRLHKSIYGLKQSAYVWGKTLLDFLTSIGFVRMKADACIFVHKEHQLIVGVYVDDVIAAFRKSSDYDWFIEQMKARFDIRDLGDIKECLGLQVHRTPHGGYKLNQEKYIVRLMDKFNVMESKRCYTPRSAGAQLYKDDSPKIDPTLYRGMIGALIYLTTGSRPDICEAVSLLASFSNDPRKVHKRQVEHVMKYLYNTRHYSIHYKRTLNSDLYAMSDASHATCPKTGKSRTGYVVFHADAPTSWKSHRQTVVAPSTRDAEYIAASQCSRDIVYSREFLLEINRLVTGKTPYLKPTLLLIDCQPALNTIEREGFADKAKSIRLSFHTIRDLYQHHEINPQKIHTSENIADLLTKPLTSEKTRTFCSGLFKA
jgi:hypothetical protein